MIGTIIHALVKSMLIMGHDTAATLNLLVENNVHVATGVDIPITIFTAFRMCGY